MHRISHGTHFTFSIEKKLLFVRWSRGYGLGQIVELERGKGIVHVRILKEGENELAVTDIGHIPILMSEFIRSVYEILDAGPVPAESETAVQEWRTSYHCDEAGAFSVSLSEAIKLIWDTAEDSVTGKCGGDYWIESAYPIPSDDGSLKKVRAIARYSKS